ncbi:MAG: DUF4382 domain-containing protein [Cellvibrionaceae bacterium]
MSHSFVLRYSTLLSGIVMSVLLVSCGGGSGGSDSGDSSRTSSVSLRFSDAPVEDAAKVVITVDAITFSRDGADIVVNTFTSDELGIENAETFQIDLLEVQGNDNRLVLDVVELPVGDYRDLRIRVLDEDINFSYVEEVGTGLLKPIKVPSNELKLGAFTVANTGSQTFVIEFGLRQSLVYNPTPERYILKPRGVRIVDLDTATTLAGTVDLVQLHAPGGCSDKPDPTVGNVAYLYTGHDLDTANLGDVFIREGDEEPASSEESTDGPVFDPDAPAEVIAPHAVAEIDGADGSYLFSYLLSGDYTLALSCAAEQDDPVIYDGLLIPFPATEIVEITLGIEENRRCDFPLSDGACSND